MVERRFACVPLWPLPSSVSSPRWELIASQKTVPQIRDFIGADSLGYLSIAGLIKAVALPKENFCLACFTGDYPIPVQLEMDKLALEAMATARKDSR